MKKQVKESRAELSPDAIANGLAYLVTRITVRLFSQMGEKFSLTHEDKNALESVIRGFSKEESKALMDGLKLHTERYYTAATRVLIEVIKGERITE